MTNIIIIIIINSDIIIDLWFICKYFMDSYV